MQQVVDRALPLFFPQVRRYSNTRALALSPAAIGNIIEATAALLRPSFVTSSAGDRKRNRQG